jgi:glycosyltransferase involved in cell wall biosynthesis
MNQVHFIQRLQEQQPQTILILPFEDTTVEPLLRKQFPRSIFTVLTKKDLAGVPPVQLVRLLLKKRYDLAIASLYESAVRRSESSLQILLCVTRTHARFLRTEDNSYTSFSRQYIIYRTLPQFLAAGILGIAAAVLLFTFSFFSILCEIFPKQPSYNNQNKTILFLRTDLSGALAAGGSVSHVKGMIRAFQRAGYRVIYIADARIDALPSQVMQIVVRPMQFFDVFDEFQLIAYNFQLLRHTKKWMREYYPAFLYQRHSIFSIVGGIMARRMQIPCVLEVNASEVWVKAHWSRLFFIHLAKRCEAVALKLADKVAVISDGVREQLGPYGLPAEQLIYNPNGVDTDEFHPLISGDKIRTKYNLNDAIVVGFIGTFTRWHGVETLFEAAVQIVKHDSNIFFLLIGDGDLRSSLQHRTKELGISDRLLFTGIVRHTEAPAYLAACDILVSPHLGFEGKEKFFGSPTKLFEYMAMGKAIIASNLEQIGEIIHDGINGLLVQPGNAEELAEKIVQLSHEQTLRIRLGQNARKMVAEKYTWDKNVERIMNALL